ncbi:unnamed protein product [Gongylonema pulchrum]|uniref:Vesicle transport protein n=1 Tax=Gongylonema pulchrum TaxID=637853 RepID=A0A183EB44_9BILA|nr:unnamed protein product [Gongylonema pulchrum]
MSDLQEFVNQQKAKNSFFGSAASSAASFPTISSIRSKITSGLNGFSTVLSPGSDSDREALTESAEPVNGQLPSTRNRKNNGWFSSVSGEETLFGMSRMQRITAFFMSITAAFLCFGTVS